MSAKLMGQIWGLDIPSPEREVLMALCDHADDNGENCFPGIDYLQWKVGKSERQLRNIIGALVENSIVEVLIQGNGRGNRSEYKIHLQKAPLKPQFQAFKNGLKPSPLSSTAKTRQREYQLINKYGLTLDGYNELLIAQKGVCRICQLPPLAGGKPLVVDHNHETGEVRGLLCDKCNRGIGMIGDSSLQAAANYLKGEKPAINSVADNSVSAVKVEIVSENQRSQRVKTSESKVAIQRQNSGAIRKNHVNHIEPSKEPSSEPVDAASLKSGHREHPHFEVFRKAFEEFYETPCPVIVGGFVQFADLLKLHNGNLDLAEWSKAVRNYFLSDISNRTFADLCTKYAEYHKNPLDKYRRPVTRGNGSGKPKRAAV